MRKLAPLLVALALALACEPASAGELFATNGGAVFYALPGEANRLVFSRKTFKDRDGYPIAPTLPCRSLTSSHARCPLTGPDPVGIALGDRSDRFRVASGSRLPRGSLIKGGKGNDRLRSGPGPQRIECGPGRDRVAAGSRDTLIGCEIVRRP